MSDERQLGELLGEVKGEMRALRQQMVDMEARNSAEHSAVLRRFDTLGTKLDTKASETWVKEHETRIDGLEAKRDEGKGMAKLVKIAEGVGLFVIAFAGFLLAKGLLG